MRKREDLVSGDPDSDPELKELRKKANALRRERPNLLRTMIVKEMPQPRVSYIHLGGDFTRKGAEVKPGVPAALPPLAGGSQSPNRLDLARWLVDRRNPLTARVAVNRIWRMHFGRGLVATQEDFGSQGRLPTHPELLDLLSAELAAQKFDMKWFLREVALSETYQRSTLLPQGVEHEQDDVRSTGASSGHGGPRRHRLADRPADSAGERLTAGVLGYVTHVPFSLRVVTGSNAGASGRHRLMKPAAVWPSISAVTSVPRQARPYSGIW